MPTKRKLYCVLRSPHVDKDSREHFEIRVHKRIIDIYEPSSQTIDSLMKLDLPSGVDISVVL
jgi:small subunit ribosomal protein S10